MGMWRMIGLAPLLVLVSLNPGTGLDLPLAVLGEADLSCPVCRQEFTTVLSAQSNTRGGVDRDLFARALGAEPVFYLISTCPSCGYSGYPADFSPQIDLAPDVRSRILDGQGLELPDGFTPESDPRELGAPERYRLAIQCYLWRQRSDEALGWLHLRASWVERDLGSNLPPDDRLVRVIEYAEQWRPSMRPQDNQADVEMKLATRMAEAVEMGEFNRYQRPYVELAIALILRRHGENRQARPMLERLASHEHFSKELHDGIASMLATIDAEQIHQRAAAQRFEQALLADRIDPVNRGAACYVLAELNRRLGRDTEAIRWYDRAVDDPRLPDDLRTWAREQRAWAAADRK